jgi:hypothetical protein
MKPDGAKSTPDWAGITAGATTRVTAVANVARS